MNKKKQEDNNKITDNEEVKSVERRCKKEKER